MLYSQYTPKALRVLFFARYEAFQLGSEVIKPAHLLLGLIRERLRISFLSDFKILRTLRQDIENRIVHKGAPISPNDLTLRFSPETERIIANAHNEFRSNNGRWRSLTVAHLLIGILREKNSLPSQVLRKRGLDLHSARRKARRYDGL